MFLKKSECSFHTRGDSKKLFMLMYINENMNAVAAAPLAAR